MATCRNKLIYNITFCVLRFDVFLASSPSMAVCKWRADLILLLDKAMFLSEYSFQSLGVNSCLFLGAGPYLAFAREKVISLFFFGAVILRFFVCWSISMATSLSMRSFSKSDLVFCSLRSSSAANCSPWFRDSWTPLMVATSSWKLLNWLH